MTFTINRFRICSFPLYIAVNFKIAVTVKIIFFIDDYIGISNNFIKKIPCGSLTGDQSQTDPTSDGHSTTRPPTIATMTGSISD